MFATLCFFYDGHFFFFFFKITFNNYRRFRFIEIGLAAVLNFNFIIF